MLGDVGRYLLLDFLRPAGPSGVGDCGVEGVLGGPLVLGKVDKMCF